MSLIKEAFATGYNKEALGGRNLPLVIEAELPDGCFCEGFLKLPGRGEFTVEGMFNELLASMLAGDLGLNTPQPLLLKISDEWLSSLPSNVRNTFDTPPVFCFCSMSAGPQWTLWKRQDSLPKSLVEIAMEIIAFDAFIENADRRKEKPNLLRRGDELFIIDHELAFGTRMCLFPKPTPWKESNLNRLASEPKHIFLDHLKGKEIPKSKIKDLWSNISDDLLMAYRAQIPMQWFDIEADLKQAVDDAVEHIRQVRDKIDDCLNELDRVLND